MPVSSLLQLCSLQQTTPSVRGLPAFPEPSACVAVVGSSVFHLVCSLFLFSVKTLLRFTSASQLSHFQHYYVTSGQFSSVAQSCRSLCDPMNRSTPGLPVQHQLPEFTQTQIHRVGDAIQPSHPLSSPSPPASNPSQHQSLFQSVNTSHEVAKYWSFSFSISPSKEHSGLVSFRMDCLDLLAV